MATVKKGVLIPAGEWWKHLRWTKPAFWRRHRQAERRAAREEARAARADGEVRNETAALRHHGE
jgi:hypothetical protein